MIVKTSALFDFFYLMSVISISLGITNLLPIPGLDGGKIFLLMIELIRRKKVSEEIELRLTAIGMLLLLTLALFVTYQDIGKIL